MRWVVIVIACVLGVIGLLVVLVMLPLKVSVRFERIRGRTAIRVWVGVLSGLVWVPVYRKAPRPGEEGVQAANAVAEDGASVVRGWLSRLQAFWTSLADPGDGGSRGEGQSEAGRGAGPRLPGGGRGKQAARRRRDMPRRIGRFLYAAVKSTGLDVHRLGIRMELGSGEAATSAIGVGLAYALINTGLAASPVPLRFPVQRPEIRIAPRYDRAGFDASVDCIVALTPGYIILRGIQIRRRRRRTSCPTTR